MSIRRNLLILLGAAPFTLRVTFAQSEAPILIGWLSFGSRAKVLGLTMPPEIMMRASRVIQ